MSDFEDHTDISGQPDPGQQAMTPNQMLKSMHARTAGGHMKQPHPEPGPAPSPAGVVAQGPGSLAHQAIRGLQHAAGQNGSMASEIQNQLQESGQHLTLLPNWNRRPDQSRTQNPVFQRLVNDPWYAYTFGHNFFDDMSKIQNAYGQIQAKSVQKQWEEGHADPWTTSRVALSSTPSSRPSP